MKLASLRWMLALSLGVAACAGDDDGTADSDETENDNDGTTDDDADDDDPDADDDPVADDDDPDADDDADDDDPDADDDADDDDPDADDDDPVADDDDPDADDDPVADDDADGDDPDADDDVDTAETVAEGGVALRFNGTLDVLPVAVVARSGANLSLTANEESDSTKQLMVGAFNIPDEGGTFECGPQSDSSSISIVYDRDGETYQGGGNVEDTSCSFTLTAVPESRGDFLIGTFGGTLVDTDGNVHTIEDGAINAPRAL